MHIHILPLHVRRVGVQQRTVVSGEKALTIAMGQHTKLSVQSSHYSEDAVICVIMGSR